MAYEPRGDGDRGGAQGQDGAFVKVRGRRKYFGFVLTRYSSLVTILLFVNFDLDLAA